MEHIIVEGKRIYISAGLKPVFIFLSSIEKEIETILAYRDKIEKNRQFTTKILDILGKCAEISQNKGIIADAFYKMIADKETDPKMFNINSTLIRSNMILIFSYIETLFCIITTYAMEEDNQEKIIYNSKNKLINNIEKYLINKKNSFYRNNKEKFGKIRAKDIKALRNGLVHFYSISSGNISLSDADFSNQENIKENFHKENISVLSSYDLFELTKAGSKVFIKELAYDFKNNPKDFNRKIKIVKDVVKTTCPRFLSF